MITVSTKVKGSLDSIWDHFTSPEHIIHWSFASEDWHSPWAKNDLRVDGKFTTRMEAKDGSFGFDFEGIYEAVAPYKGYTYSLEDGRKIIVTFEEVDGGVIVREDFDPETENTHERQQYGWQCILDNFKKYSESLAI
ncbi:MAG: SRPBCC domain-containing protein [Clostridia bacterium]